jgi:hypothetical protein
MKFADFENNNLIQLELSKELQDTEMVEDFIFEIDTKISRSIIFVIHGNRSSNRIDPFTTYHLKNRSRIIYQSLISKSDLLADNNYDYDPDIINNITKYENSDRWFCTYTKCKSTGDK